MQLQTTSLTEIMSIGKAFAESGMFTDIKTAAQAIVKIQAGAEIGLPPFASMSGIHIIQGKPAIGAGLMASSVKASGKYDYRVIEQNDTVCSIDFFQGKEKIGNSTFTIADAKKALTKNIDKFPKNMLFARAMSNGVKWFTPDIFKGSVYTPEELNSVVTENATFEILPSTEDITTATNALNAAKNLDQLKDAYTSTPDNVKPHVLALKDELKAKLTLATS